jgi:transposase-like protein
MKKYTITEFRKHYGTDDACLDKIFRMKLAKMDTCPKCSQTPRFHKVSARKCYECVCGYQLYPLKGTIFEKSRTPLSYWFYAMYLMTATRNGVAAKELERQLGISYKCAFRMAHRIRLLMRNKTMDLTEGVVEIDEVGIGGQAKFMHRKKRAGLKRGRGSRNMTTVFGMLQRNGKVIAFPVDSISLPYLTSIIRSTISKDVLLVTDAMASYQHLKKEYRHEVVNHNIGEYVRGEYHTNTIEGFWSHLKRMIKGTHIHISKQHMQKYIDECVFRYELRKRPGEMFAIILSRVSLEDSPLVPAAYQNPPCGSDSVLASS